MTDLVAQVREIASISIPAAKEVVLHVLQAIDSDMLLSEADKEEILRHCQRGNSPESWYYWHRRGAAMPLQMPTLWTMLQRKQKLEEELQSLSFGVLESNDGKTN